MGAGVARDAAMRGLSVTLLEKHTVGWGTSSRSSRLAHGGIRYLETGDIALVREALAERATLLRIAPQLVRPVSFLFVLERGAWWQWLRVGIGVTLYGALAGRRALGAHHPVTRGGLVNREPLLARTPLQGGAIYQDARCDDIGLVRATIQSAMRHGATVIEHCHAAVAVEEGGVAATLSDGTVIRARTLVVATGPWTDAVRRDLALPDRQLVGGTKGIHITVPLARLPLSHAIALRHPGDQRVMFCIPEPEHDQVVIGTTDTDTDEPPDALTVADADVAYLLRAVQHLFPGRDLSEADIVDRWAGVRPLLRQPGAASSRSREHLMLREGAVLTIAGGKLTTYRSMAEEAVDRLGEMLERTLPASRTAEELL
ncbi:MAG: glycerol-3-phosphate dehydrogenase/oxidase [Gemmatimonadales bacterium]|nr:glycerol-3-phosphate dehydrogenase/oxidase [Gemmatimonadales bacterium]